MVEQDRQNNFGDWLNVHRREHNVSQRKLAKASGVARSTVWRAEKGSRMPTLRTAARIAVGLRQIVETDILQKSSGVEGVVPESSVLEVPGKGIRNMSDEEVRQAINELLDRNIPGKK